MDFRKYSILIIVLLFFACLSISAYAEERTISIASEVCDDSNDNDGDGYIDCFDYDCAESRHCKDMEGNGLCCFVHDDKECSFFGSYNPDRMCLFGGKYRSEESVCRRMCEFYGYSFTEGQEEDVEEAVEREIRRRGIDTTLSSVDSDRPRRGDDHCTDTDDGKNFDEAGSVTWKNEFDNSEGTLYDHCVGTEIIEYYCQEDGIRNVAYKDCYDEGKVCKDAVCVEIELGECSDPDGDDVTTKGWAEGTNVWNEGLVNWGDYCSETIDGGSTDSGPYVHEAVCLETDDGFYEVRYASPQKCKDGCVDGICVGSGEVEEKSPKEACNDMDDGKDIEKASYVHGDSGYMVGDFYDFCSDSSDGIGHVDEGKYVHEYFCEDGFVVGMTIECDKGCYLGQCGKGMIDEELMAADEDEERRTIREELMSTYERQTRCSAGQCAYEDTCVPIGYRADDKFCDLSGIMKEQMRTENPCQNDFECLTNNCMSGECHDLAGELEEQRGLLKRILDFFKNLF